MIMIHVPEVVPVISHVYVHDRDSLNSVGIPITMTVYTSLYNSVNQEPRSESKTYTMVEGAKEYKYMIVLKF